MPPEHACPRLEWEACLWRWYLRLQRATVHATEPLPGGGSFSKPCALDRSAWWPVIAREHWCHRTAMDLLESLEHGLFDPLTGLAADDSDPED